MTTKIKLNQVYPIPAPAFNSELTGTPTAPTPSTNDDSNMQLLHMLKII